MFNTAQRYGGVSRLSRVFALINLYEVQRNYKEAYIIENQLIASIYIYISCVCARICAHARAYMHMEATHFSGISFSGNRRGSAFLPWIGVARVFPEKGWTGASLLVVARYFQRGRWTGVGGPAVFPFPSGLIVINGHKKAPG